MVLCNAVVVALVSGFGGMGADRKAELLTEGMWISIIVCLSSQYKQLSEDTGGDEYGA